VPWIIVLGNRDAIEWVMTEGRMAVSPRVSTLPDEGDKAILYTARGAFGNPTDHRAQVVGLATVAGPVRHKDVVVAGQTYARSFPLDIAEAVDAVPYAGLDFYPLVDRLDFVLNKAPTNWGGYLRRPLVHISDKDYKTIATAFRRHVGRVSAATRGSR
jgi:hypothetical protein